MAMQSHDPKKAPQNSTAPVNSQFQSRPFAVQAKPQTQETPDLQTQLEKAKLCGHNFANISVQSPCTPTPPRIQPKLTIGEPGDKYEQEADKTAAEVVQRLHAPVPSYGRDISQPESQFAQRMKANLVQRSNPVQRQGIPNGENKLMKKLDVSALQREVMAEEEKELQMKPTLQRQSGEGGMSASPDLEATIQQARGSGQPLAQSIREPMEQAVGADFSGVKIHTDAQSDQMNQSIQAKAFTTGKNIFFRQGAYEPGSRGGQELLAHELTHVVQQNGGAVQRMITQADSDKSVVQRAWVEDNGVQTWDELIDGVTWFAQGSEVMWFKITDASQIKQGREEEYKLYEGQKKLSKEWELLRLTAISKDELGRISPEGWQKFASGQENSTKRELADLSDRIQAVQSAPKSIEELAQNAESSCSLWIKQDDILLDILLGPLEANWFKAKACLTMDLWPSNIPKNQHPPHAVGIKIMQALVDMRTRKWKEFTDKIKPEFTERMKMYGDQELRADVGESQKEKGKNLLDIFDSVGAQAVTSDVDLASGGSNSELGVQFVNSKFRLEFVKGKVLPYDPGTVFDINLYASDWIHGEAGFLDSESGVRTIKPKAEVENMSAEAEKERTKKMEIWSLVKIRRNMSPEEWVSYEEMTLGSITDRGTRDEMNQKLIEADFEYQTFKLRVETKQKEMEKKLKSQEEAFFNGRESAFGHDNEEYQKDAHFTRAANAIYEETLAEVKILRLQINKLKAEKNGAVRNDKAISNLGIQLGNKIAEALTYANEVYATEGAVQHTVLKQGANKKLAKLKQNEQNQHLTGVDYNLKPELYLQSVNENVGDSLHSINHFQKVPHYAVYRAGKYLSRLCDAAEQLLTSPGAKKAPFYEDLELIGQNAVRVKAIKEGDIEGDPEYVKQDIFFKDYNESNLSTVRQEIINFGAAIPQLFNKKKQADEEQQKQAGNVQQQQEELSSQVEVQ